MLPSTAQRIATSGAVIDCGQVLFCQPVTAEFEITNKANRTLHVEDIRTDCGCTVAEISQTDIRKGEIVKLRSTFDARMLGHFQKQVAVYSNDGESPLVLTMRGVVVDEIKDFVGEYAYDVDGILIDHVNLEYDNVGEGDVPYQRLHIKNNTGEAVTPQMMHLPDYLYASVSPSTLAPGRAGTVELFLNSSRLPDYGLTQTTIYLGRFPGDKVSDEKAISISAVLLPSFSDMTETEMLNAPQIVLSEQQVNLTGSGGKGKLRGTIEIENKGGATLDISRLQMFTSGMEVSLGKSQLAPGDKTKLKVTAVADELKKQKTKPRILIITNDPNHSKITLNINCSE